MDRTFKITNDFCLFTGDILDFDNVNIDNTKISKINVANNNHVKNCNEYEIGQTLNKYQEFLTADNCNILTREINGNEWIYENERDEYIFNKCNKSIKNSPMIEVYVYNKSGNDLQYYMDQPDKLENLLTRNKSISIYDGVNILLLYFTNILSILKYEKIIHKDIKPENIIVGDDLYNFPYNIKIIDFGYSFEYHDLNVFLFKQSIDLYGESIYFNMVRKYGNMTFEDLAINFTIDYYDTVSTMAHKNIDDIFSVLTNIATPKYSSPEFNPRVSSIVPIATSICVDFRTSILEVRRDIVKYIIDNQYDIDYTKLAELYTFESDIDDGYFNIIKNNTIGESIINQLLKYNDENNTKYNLFEYLYIISNGLTGDNPLLYNYDLYAFGLILRQVIDVYQENIQKNLLFDPRKYRAKKTVKRRTRFRGGAPKSIDYTRDNYNILKDLNYIVDNMINKDCIYRWTIDDIYDYYNGDMVNNDMVNNDKYITIFEKEYRLCSDIVTKESIIKQFQLINKDLNIEIIAKNEWDEMRDTLKTQGMSARKIGSTITKMKSKMKSQGVSRIEDIE
jgi:serine/threonine protein kinase